jgi:hypothetical protein
MTELIENVETAVGTSDQPFLCPKPACPDDPGDDQRLLSRW